MDRAAPFGAHRATPPSPGRGRHTIAAILDNLDDGYQRNLWAGLEAAGRAAGVNVVHFLGGNLNPEDPVERRRNGIFDLISPEGVDGLVIPTMVMASHIGPARLEEYCRRFRPLPMVSLGGVLPSMPSLVCEGRRGMRELVTHLVRDHRRRRLAFVSGTPENPDSVLRLEVFRETLGELGLPFDPRLHLRGWFVPEKAAARVRAAVAEGIPFDAVVCASDEMALAVIDALQDAGVRVPEAVSVTGYDDIPAAACQLLPLTTVRQPTVELARRGVEVLLGLVRGEPAGPTEELAAALALRRSCGCLPAAVVRAGTPAGGRGVRAPSLGDAVLAALAAGGAPPVDARVRRCVAELAAALADEVRGEAADGTFAANLDRWLAGDGGAALGDEAGEELVTALRREALPRLAPAAAVEARLHQARVLLKERAGQRDSRAYAQLRRKTRTLQYVIENLIGSFDVPTLLDSMARELPRIGVRRCYLAVHASSDRVYQDTRLLMAHDEGGRREVGEGIVYPARRILPEGMPGGDEPWNLVLQPLIFEEEEVGFLALGYDPRGDVSGLALAQQLRSALKASMMMQEIREKDRRLLEIDRLRSEFVANVTHDFRSLVGIVMDTSWLAARPGEVDDPAVLRGLSGDVYEASLRLKVAIDRLLDLASMDDRGLVVRIRPFRARRFLAELAAFYRPVLARSGIALEEELPAEEVAELWSDPDKVEQIMHNLVSNAAKAVATGGGRIRLSLTVSEQRAELAVSDDGVGIPPERLEAIFVRFGACSQGRAGAGTGIGLAFVKELARYLRGEIRAASDGPGRGARFTLTLPRGRGVHPDAAQVEERGGEGPAQEVASAREQFRRLLESSLRGRPPRG